MKWLTLNIHSWMEEDTEEKMDILVHYIISSGLDGVSLQEVNQRIDALPEENPLHFVPPINEKTIIKQDNYALCLVKRLAELGEEYHWSWTYSHVGYGIYEEGVAILSKKPLQSQAVLVSSVDKKTDVTRRMMLCSKLTVQDKELFVTSSHYSWWNEETKHGFQDEWTLSKLFLDKLSGFILLCGDFNGPDTIKNETYDLVTKSFVDTFELAEHPSGRYTIPKEIDGWKHTKEQLRIDYIFASEPCQVRSHDVIFDGENYPCISDHYGVVVSIDME